MAHTLQVHVSQCARNVKANLQQLLLLLKNGHTQTGNFEANFSVGEGRDSNRLRHRHLQTRIQQPPGGVNRLLLQPHGSRGHTEAQPVMNVCCCATRQNQAPTLLLPTQLSCDPGPAQSFSLSSLQELTMSISSLPAWQ